VDAGAVGLGDASVAADHGQVGVAEQVLQSEEVPTAAQVGDGEGVTKAVGVDVGDAGALANAGKLAAQDAAVHRPLIVGGSNSEEGIAGLGGQTRGEVAPERLDGAFADLDEAVLIAFAVTHEDAIASHVEIVDAQVAQLGGADAGVEEDEQDAAIPVGDGGELLFADGSPGFLLVANGKQGLDFGLGEGVYDGLAGAGRLDGADDVGGDEFLLGSPAPEGGEVRIAVTGSSLLSDEGLPLVHKGGVDFDSVARFAGQ